MAEIVPTPAHPTSADKHSGALGPGRAVPLSELLGDDGPLARLTVRDHVLGLEAELLNARAEAAHWHAIALELRRQSGTTKVGRLLLRLRVVARRVIFSTRAGR